MNITWFKFTPANWIMGRIQRVPEITQARFMRLCCVYWNKKCELNYDDAVLEIDEEHLKCLIRFKIIKNENGFIKIEFLDEQISGIREISQKAAENAAKRWNKQEKEPKPKEPIKPVEEIDFKGLLEFINKSFNRSFKTINNTVKNKFKARLKEGYTKPDIINCINNLVQVQYHKENGYQYCTPEFISRADTLEKYSSKTNKPETKQLGLTLGKIETG